MQSCGRRSKKSLSRPLYVARYTGVPATMIRARVAASSAAVTVAAVPRPSSGSAGSTRCGVAPRAASRPRAYSTRRRDLDVADGLPEIPTATTSVVKSLTLPRSGPAPDLLGLVQETLQRERPDEEMLRLEEQPHTLLAWARFRADQHEPAAELRPDLQRVFPQPQSPTLRHVQIRDDGVEPLSPDGLEPFDPVRRRQDPTPPPGQRSGDGFAHCGVVFDHKDRQRSSLACVS